jgi:hypothetical protein
MNDKDTTNIVSLQMNVGVNTQFSHIAYGFNNSSIGKNCVAKCEEENGQIIIIQGIAMKLVSYVLCCVQYHCQENKT